MKERTTKEIAELNAKRHAALKNLEFAAWNSLEKKLQEEDDNIMKHRQELLEEERAVLYAKFFNDGNLYCYLKVNLLFFRFIVDERNRIDCKNDCPLQL